MNNKSDTKMKATTNWIITNEDESLDGMKAVCAEGYAVYDTRELMLAVAKTKKYTPIELNFRNETSDKALNKRKKLEKGSHSMSKHCSLNNFEVSDVQKDCPIIVKNNNGKRKRCDSSSLSVPDLSVKIRKESGSYDKIEPSYEKQLSFVVSDVAGSLEKGAITSDPHDFVEEKVDNVKKVRSNEYLLYKIENSNKYILHLCHPGTFSFQGKLKITLLAGRIEVFGFSPNDSNCEKSLELYAPRRCMNLTIKTKPAESTAETCNMETILRDEMRPSKSNMEKLSMAFQPNDVLLLLEKLSTPLSGAMSSYCRDLDLFFENQISAVGSTREKDLDCVLEGSYRKQFTTGSSWSELATKECNVTCGGKGVGKSTLLKYLVNRRLCTTDKVLWLDFDPGQTEFTPPGCVSGVVVDKPFLGPNFTHLAHPEKMVYTGSVNVGLDPTGYMESVKYVIDSCREDPNLVSLPWFVNTMGFNKGVGFDIMVNILRLLEPDVVIQISSSDETRNYPMELRPEAVESCTVEELVPIEAKQLTYNFYSVWSCAKLKRIGFQSGFTPAELRELMIVAYFAEVLRFPYFSLNAVIPFWIPMSKIYLAASSVMKPSDVLKAYNGSLVGLSRLDEASPPGNVLEVENPDSECFKIVVKPHSLPCFGLGIVRGIDCTEKKIYIVTPLPGSKLQSVNCLVLGSINPPEQIYLNQRWVDGPKVYVDMPGSRNVKCSKRKFKYNSWMNTAKNVRK